MRAGPLLTLLLFLAASFSVAGFGAQFSPGPWYAALDKPAWTPPSALFAPVWGVLYALMAVAGWRVFRSSSRWRVWALSLFALQLLLNGAWSWLFFGLQQIGLALADLTALWLVLLATTWLFFRSDRIAGWLFLPYPVWVTYALALNAAIAWMNP